LIVELPEHLAEMVRFSLATGLRKANGEAPPIRLHASRETGQECEHEGLEGGARARRDCGLPGWHDLRHYAEPRIIPSWFVNVG
jgi:hypothetical protein